MFQTEVDNLKESKDRILIKQTKIENEEYLKDLIVNLENTQKEWQETLQDLKKQKAKYNDLITEVKKIKQIIVKDGLKARISPISKLKILIFSKIKT